MNGAPPARVSRRLPGLEVLRGYRRGFATADLAAGVVVAALAVPQALGYAGLAHVPVQVGLYAIPLALVAYAVFGTSRQLIMGPVSTVSVLSGSLVLDMGAVPGSARAVALTCGLALLSGLILLASGLLRLGWFAEFLSRPIVTGFVFGLVIVIVIGELPKLLGVSGHTGSPLHQLAALVPELTHVQATTAALAVVSLAVLFGGARLAPRIPWGLVVVVSAIVVSQVADLAGDGVAVVGAVPRGLPSVGLPDLTRADLVPLLTGAAAIAMVSLAEGLSAARLFAVRHDERIETDQELVAAGAANIGAGLLGGMGVAGSLSKTAASDRAGGRTQVTGLVTALVVVLVLVLLAPRLAPLPICVLSAVVVQAVWGLMDVQAMERYAKVRRNDFLSAVIALFGVVLFGALFGLLLAIAQSVLGLVYRSSRVHLEVMGKVADEKAAWGGVTHHPERASVDGVLVLRLDNPLFWVNSSVVQDQVRSALKQHPGTSVVILDLEATPQLDTTSVDTLTTLLRKLRAEGTDLYLVRVLRQCRGVLQRSGFLDELGDDHVWHSISQGVKQAKHVIKVQRKEAARAEGREPVEADHDLELELELNGDDVDLIVRDEPLVEPADLAADDDRPGPVVRWIRRRR